MYRKLLVGFDGSESSKRAFEIALQCAAKDGAELFVLAVAERHVIADEVESRAVLDDSLNYYKSSFASLRDVTLAKGVKTRFEVAVGDFCGSAGTVRRLLRSKSYRFGSARIQIEKVVVWFRFAKGCTVSRGHVQVVH